MMNRRRLGGRLLRLAPLAGLTALTACQFGSAGDTTAPAPAASPVGSTPTPLPLPIEAVDPQEIITLLPPDGIPAIDNPEFMTIEETLNRGVMEDSEPVLSFGHQDVWHAYSVLQLDRHEIVNDVVSGLPIAATW